MHAIWNHGVIVFTGSLTECLNELNDSYQAIGRQPTLANAIQDGFVIDKLDLQYQTAA